jgi:hypothetical protein
MSCDVSENVFVVVWVLRLVTVARLYVEVMWVLAPFVSGRGRLERGTSQQLTALSTHLSQSGACTLPNSLRLSFSSNCFLWSPLLHLPNPSSPRGGSPTRLMAAKLASVITSRENKTGWPRPTSHHRYSREFTERPPQCMISLRRKKRRGRSWEHSMSLLKFYICNSSSVLPL